MNNLFPSFSRSEKTIMVIEILGLLLISLGAGLVYVPLGVILAGLSMVIVGLAVSRMS
jgi:hypothetical protein